MTIFDFLTMVGGLALFLFGMNVMGEGLERAAGNRLKTILEQLTSSPVRGFFLGLAVTAVIQSSSATTVMIVAYTSLTSSHYTFVYCNISFVTCQVTKITYPVVEVSEWDGYTMR